MCAEVKEEQEKNWQQKIPTLSHLPTGIIGFWASKSGQDECLLPQVPVRTEYLSPQGNCIYEFGSERLDP